MRKNSVLILNQYLILFQIYSRFCNMQMKCLMTSSTQHRPNKLPQMKNILCNNYMHIAMYTIRISIATKFQ